MTHKENITAILECYFAGFKDEIIDSACNRILEQWPKTGHKAVLKEWKNDFKGYINELSMLNDDYRGIMEYIDEVPNETRWIPVSERLPEDNTKVLVTTDATYKEKVLITWYQDKEHGFLCGLAKAWMPLPNPFDPQESEEQKNCDTCTYSDEIDGSNCYECVKDIRDNYNPQPKTGHWIDEGFYADNSTIHAFRCSECGEHILEYITPDDRYCRHCGAKMESEE